MTDGTTALATVLALVPMLASSYPSAFSLSQYSERVYKREASGVHKRSTELLSRSARQANKVSQQKNQTDIEGRSLASSAQRVSIY